jgi:hypothetical protein
MINYGDGLHPALDTITRITPNIEHWKRPRPPTPGGDMCGRKSSLALRTARHKASPAGFIPAGDLPGGNGIDAC